MQIVRDVMFTPLETISKDATVMEAVRQMWERDINTLVVTTTPRAIINSTDVLDAVAEGRDISELQGAGVMTSDVEIVTPYLCMEEVAAMMTTDGIKHLLVCDDDCVGMVTSMDISSRATTTRFRGVDFRPFL